jgi:hypothetical protein
MAPLSVIYSGVTGGSFGAGVAQDQPMPLQVGHPAASCGPSRSPTPKMAPEQVVGEDVVGQRAQKLRPGRSCPPTARRSIRAARRRFETVEAPIL